MRAVTFTPSHPFTSADPILRLLTMPNLSISQNPSSHTGYSAYQLNGIETENLRDYVAPTDEINNEWSSATQDIVDSLPRVWTRGLLYFLIVLTGIVLPWAMLSNVDEVGTARGRLEPKQKTITLDAPVTGKVVAVHAKEGQAVKAGQPLIEIESDLLKTDLQQAQTKLEGELNRLSQFDLMENQVEIAERTQRSQNQAQEAEQMAQADQVQRRLQSAHKALELVKARVEGDEREVERFRSLWQKGAIAEVKVAETERTLNESQRSLEQNQAEIDQAQAELMRQKKTREKIVRTGELSLLEGDRRLKELRLQKTSLQADIAQTQKTVQSLQLQLQHRAVKAPTDGTIFHLPIQQAGAVVQPGQALAQIAPKGSQLVLRSQMLSQESGFVYVGMPVKVKFDAFPFQDYGIVEGKVNWISPDTKSTDTPQGKVESFEVEIVLNQLHIQTPTKRVELVPGQTATAEVIVRQRRVIDFILDPFKKLNAGGLKL